MKKYYCYKYNLVHYNETTKDNEVKCFWYLKEVKADPWYEDDRKNCRIIKFRHYFDDFRFANCR